MLIPLGRPERNDPCRCGSGKKYKKCCLDLDVESDRTARAALPEAKQAMRARLAEVERVNARLTDEFGVFINFVPPEQFQGKQVRALGPRLYPALPLSITFHEFLLLVLDQELGEVWRATQEALPEEQRHFIARCAKAFRSWKKEAAEAAGVPDGAVWSAVPNGWAIYLLRSSN